MNVNPIGWASSSLRLVARLFNSGVNSTTPVTAISEAPIGVANADIALVAKGTGATLAQVSDGTAAGGNKRGIFATDWQKTRTLATQVASGARSVLCGGTGNIASGDQSVLGGGSSNTVSAPEAVVVGGSGNSASGNQTSVGGGQNNVAGTGTHATVGGGNGNTAGGQYSFVGSGQSNTASGSYSFIGGGLSNSATRTYNVVCGGQLNAAIFPAFHATVCGGQSNTANGDHSFIGGGRNNSASGANSAILGGGYNTANSSYGTVIGSRGVTRSIVGYVGIAAHDDLVFTSSAGTAQGGLLVLAAQTTTATPTVLVSNTLSPSSTNQVALPVLATYYFKGTIIAASFNSIYAKAWAIEGVIKRPLLGSNNVAFVGTPTVTVIATEPSVPSVASWAVAVTADTTNQCLSITVTGEALNTIRWVAKVETTEVSY